MYSQKQATFDKISKSEHLGHKLIGITRIVVGWVFLWAFLDKLFGLGYATTPAKAWINGGSPSQGFLTYGINHEGPFHLVFMDYLTPNYQIVDVLLMAMFLFVGASLLLGIGVRLASAAGLIFMISIWISAIPLENNPLIDEHILYALMLLIFATINAGKWMGLGNKWMNLPFVQKNKFLI